MLAVDGLFVILRTVCGALEKQNRKSSFVCDSTLLACFGFFLETKLTNTSSIFCCYVLVCGRFTEAVSRLAIEVARVAHGGDLAGDHPFHFDTLVMDLTWWGSERPGGPDGNDEERERCGLADVVAAVRGVGAWYSARGVRTMVVGVSGHF